MPYVGQLLGRSIAAPQRVGRIRDVFASTGARAVVTSVEVDGGIRIPWQAMAWDGSAVRFKGPIQEAPYDRDEFSLCRGLLDKQIFDARGLKVVRVNDIALSEIGGELRVTGVDVGARGFLRRLGVESVVVRLLDLLGYEVPDTVIPWMYVASLEESSGIRLGVERDLLAKLRPIEVAEILDALAPTDRVRFLGAADDRVLALALSEATGAVQEAALEEAGDERAARILRLMPPDEAADVLGALPYGTSERLLGLLAAREGTVLRELLGYHPRTAGGLMTPEFVSIPQSADVTTAVQILREAAPEAESVYYVYALDDQRRLAGVVSLADLLTAEPASLVEAITRREVVRVDADDADEKVAEVMERYDLLALPVVDEAGVLLGIITVDDVMRTLETRASDELAAMTGGADIPPGSAFAPGHLGALAGAVAVGLVAAVLLTRNGVTNPGWLAAVLLPLLLRLAHDQGAWALAAHLEADTGRAVRRTAIQVTAGTLAVLPAAAVMAVTVAIIAGPSRALWLVGGVCAAAALSAAIGGVIPQALAAGGRESWLRRGRVVPLAASLVGLLVFVALQRRVG
jgi:CBS domain-containing protein